MTYETEKGFLRQARTDDFESFSYVRTECGKWLYCHKGTAMMRDGTICPNCGKVIELQVGDGK